MGFKQARDKLVKALLAGKILHDDRSAKELKNWLATDELGIEEAVSVVLATTGLKAESQPHHFLAGVSIWIFRPTLDRRHWYVKFYWVETETYIVSFHPQEVS